MPEKDDIDENGLTARDRKALLTLARISEGHDTFFDVLDGDRLAAKGFAELFGKGQFILTDAGWALVKKWKLIDSAS